MLSDSICDLTWHGREVCFWHFSAVPRCPLSVAIDAVDGSSTRHVSATNVGADKAPQFGGAKHADGHDNWSRYRIGDMRLTHRIVLARRMTSDSIILRSA